MKPALKENAIPASENPAVAALQPQSSGSWRWALLCAAIAATAVISPMFFWGNASGHDFQFHLASWLDVAGQWRQGILYPRWAEWANWGYGEPRFIFYPPASWIFGAALGSILPWEFAPVAFIWLTLVGGGMAMWQLGRRWLSGNGAAAAAVFFAVNPYNLLIVYYRSDFAELLAIAFFPLLVWGALRVTTAGWRAVPSLALIFAAIWLCNAPAAVIATYSVVLVLVVAAIFATSVRELTAGIIAILLGFGSAAFYILPAAWEQRWVQITQVVAAELRPERNFIFARVGDPEFIVFNWKVSTLALGAMLVTGVFAVFVARRRKEFPELWWPLVALAIAASFMMLAPSGVFWRLLPKLQFVQFPWRWLDVLSVPFAFFTAAAFGRSRQQWIAWVALLVVLAASATAMARNTWWDSDDATTLADWVQSGFGYEGTDEYAPLGCDRYQLTGVTTDSEQQPDKQIAEFAKVDPDSDEIVPLSGIQVNLEKWSAERRVFTTQTGASANLELRLVAYPAWKATVDGAEVALQPVSAAHNDQVILPVPAGTHEIELSFRRTFDRTVGTTITITCLLILVVWSIAVRRPRGGAFV